MQAWLYEVYIFCVYRYLTWRAFWLALIYTARGEKPPHDRRPNNFEAPLTSYSALPRVVCR